MLEGVLSMGKFADLFRKNSGKDKDLAYVKANVTEGMSLADIVDVFEAMCRVPAKGSMLLFEAGTFSFSAPKMFSVSLVRQYPGKDDEYYQLHVDVMFEPTTENAVFSECVWDEDLGGSFFDYIRGSAAYLWAQNNRVSKIDIFVDET